MKMKADALSMAIDSMDCILDMRHEMLHAVVGSDTELCKSPDPEVMAAIDQLILTAHQSVKKLSSRARDGRLNLLWTSFVSEQKLLREHKA